MDTSSLRGVVRCLFLREIGDVAGHAGRDDKAARSPFLKMRTDLLGAVEGSVQIRLDHLVPVRDRRFEDAIIRRLSSVGNESIDFAEVGDHVGHQLVDLFEFGDITFERLGPNAIAPVTTTTLPRKLNRSARLSLAGTSIGMLGLILVFWGLTDDINCCRVK